MNIKEMLEELIEITEENERYKLFFKDLGLERCENISITDTAKTMNVKPMFLINYLIFNKYIFRNQNGFLRPYQEYIDKGYFDFDEFYKHGLRVLQTLVTPDGREFLRSLDEIGEFSSGKAR